MIRKENITMEITIKKCDFCEKEDSKTFIIRQCDECQRHCCGSHAHSLDYNEWGQTGDRWDYFCTDCFPIVVEHYRKCEDLNSKYEQEIEKIMNECHEKTKNKRNENEKQ